jgi:hypothetical protein
MGILEALHPLMQPGLILAKEEGEAVAAENVNAFAPMPLIA